MRIGCLVTWDIRHVGLGERFVPMHLDPGQRRRCGLTMNESKSFKSKDTERLPIEERGAENPSFASLSNNWNRGSGEAGKSNPSLGLFYRYMYKHLRSWAHVKKDNFFLKI